MRLTDLSQPELDVMLLLAQSKATNVVLLAADLWRTTPDWLATDPYPLLTYVLDGLSERGLCTYRLQRGVTLNSKRRTPDLPMDIRLTPMGWALMGYPNKTVEVGSHGRHERQSEHPGDMTDYVNLAGITFGGPIERDTFGEHRRDYHDHNHMYGVPLPMANQSTQEKRPYTRVTADIEARVIHAREKLGGVGYADIAEYTGLSTQTVKYILTDLPRLRRVNAGEAKAEGSLKERVMVAVREIGPIKDVAELRRIVGMADSDHDVMHVLHSLHTQGRIDFDERGNGMGTATCINIRLHKKGSKRDIVNAGIPFGEIEEKKLPDLPADYLAPLVQPKAESEATEQEPHVLPPSAPGPVGAGYPLLDALLDRERKRLDGDTKGMAFVVAAEAIQDIDPDTARSLMEKAKQYDVPFPSPIEAEYIRYVASHPPKENA